ncbi:MAG TPA: thiamine pyrophosphate-dependent enzyme [Actinomycetota bacterium]|nr:thiamine pyrophosphate-dependent enzyme [Actinomycetota bacterium]
METRERVGKHRGVPAEEAIQDFKLACMSRFLDDREITLHKQSKVFFQISGAGHESLYLGLARHLDHTKDWFFPYYRDRALMLGLGVSPADILRQAVGAADDPASGGRQMPCHWGFADRNVVTQSSATASQANPAVGCAEAGRYIIRRPGLKHLKAHPDEVVYMSIGEGACAEGEFWEAVSSAATLHLPVLFVVADNGYAISVRSDDQFPAPISEIARGFRGLAVTKIDGTDYFEVRRKGAKAIARVRAGEGPALIHARVTRPYSHSMSDDQKKYRTPADLEEEALNDPINKLENELVGSGVLTAEEAAAIREEAKQIVAEAGREALEAPRPDPATVLHHLTDPLPPEITEGEPGGEGDPITMGDAINRTLHDEMGRDERIRVFGEDVADAYEDVLADVRGKGGVFGITFGLQRKYGMARVFNTPLAEANIIGRAVGQGVRGLRPCPEIQFFDYIWPAMTQIRTEAATIRWRSNGAFSSPMVIRVATGGYLQGGSIWHSQCGESIFAHTPGIHVCFPSRARDAVGLLRYAFRHANDPVLFCEHKHLYRQMHNRDPYPDDDYVIPFGKGTYVQRGDDVTVVTYGATVWRSAQAAKELAREDVSVEIIDLRTISPWDKEIVAESIRKTSRVVVVHEDTQTAGFGAEIAAWITENLFWDLDAPVKRVTALDTWVAYEPKLEDAILPQASDIAAALREIVEI